MRDVYDDMMLDGVKPQRDIFHSLIIGTMKGSRLQDAFFFTDEMKAMGLVPDVISLPSIRFLFCICIISYLSMVFFKILLLFFHD